VEESEELARVQRVVAYRDSRKILAPGPFTVNFG